jgi:shikimate kinase
MRIYLTGFMGSGKTHWGKIWAQKAGLTFYDLDELIENAHHQSVSEIFEKKGEDFFRKVEAEMLRETSIKDNCIIACGGGTPCFGDNLKWMNEHGCTVYLKATPRQLLENVMQETQKRPLLKKLNSAELLFFIEKKLQEREVFYSAAAIQLQAEVLTNDTIDNIITHAIK